MLNGCDSVTLTSTPIAKKASGFEPFSNKIEKRPVRNGDLAREMDGHFIGPMDPLDFLNHFLPMRTRRANKCMPNDWGFLKEAAVEDDMYAPFVATANLLVKSLVFVDTHSPRDTHCDRLSPDVSAYQKSKCSDKLDFSRMEFFVEFKPPGVDPFCDETDYTKVKQCVFERKTHEAAKIRGQIASYVAAIAGSQFRIHIFSALICGKSARLIFWDRSGAVVTQQFDCTSTHYLSEFFERYSVLGSASRGHDPTVTALTAGDAEILNQVEPKLRGENPSRHREVRRLRIHSRNASVRELENPDGGHPFLISYPPAFPYSNRSPFGRATRGMMAYDEHQGAYVFIKDYWRPVGEQMEKEGEIYRSLEGKGVPFIARFGHGNDFLLQKTKSDALMTKHWVCSHPKLQPRQHYRLSLNDIAKPLCSFNSSRELVTAIADAMEAHDRAYFDAHILHRDISVGNIMIGPDGRGLLIDWDLCIRRGLFEQRQGGGQQARCLQRTGTWQFISAAMCQEPTGMQDIGDDRESAFYVLTWAALCYTSHSGLSNLDTHLRPYNEAYADADGTTKGGCLKQTMLATAFGVRFDQRPQLDALVTELQKAFSTRYIHSDLVRTDEGPKRMKIIREDNGFVQVLRHHLITGDWPEDDKAKKNPLGGV